MKLMRGLTFSATSKYSVETLWHWLLAWALFLLLDGSLEVRDKEAIPEANQAGWSWWRSR